MPIADDQELPNISTSVATLGVARRFLFPTQSVRAVDAVPPRPATGASSRAPDGLLYRDKPARRRVLRSPPSLLRVGRDPRAVKARGDVVRELEAADRFEAARREDQEVGPMLSILGTERGRGSLVVSVDDTRCEEDRDLGLRRLSACDAHRQLHELVRVAREVAFVQIDEHDHGRRRDALVAVDERVVLGEVKQVRRSSNPRSRTPAEPPYRSI